MSATESRFDIWWNTNSIKRIVGAAYSLGASVVIIGAMFKILHLPGAGPMLGTGMCIEALLFALGVFDKPHQDYEWDKVYDFKGAAVKGASPGIMTGAVSQQVVAAPTRAVGFAYTETINDDDVKKLSEGIKNLTETAQQLSSLSDVVGPTAKFVQNIESAASATGQFTNAQESLNVSAGLLSTSYQGITGEMEVVGKNTKQYAVKMEDINKNLASINSIYEIQLKNIQAQSEGLTQQTERVRMVNDQFEAIVGDVQKMTLATKVAAEETENFKKGTVKLSKQVTDLNQVYGNMLNALS